MSTASLGLPSLLCVVLAASSPPLEHQCWKAFVSKAGRMPHVLQLKTGLKGGEWSFGKDKCTDGPTVGLFLGSLHIINTDGGCCFSPSPEHFTPVLVIKLSLPSRLPSFPCFSLCFSCGNIYIPPGNCHQGADFPCSLSSCCSHLEALGAPEYVHWLSTQGKPWGPQGRLPCGWKQIGPDRHRAWEVTCCEVFFPLRAIYGLYMCSACPRKD